MNPTNLDLFTLILLLKGLLLAAPLATILLLVNRRLSARSLSLGWRTLLLAMLAFPTIFWFLPSLPLIDIHSSLSNQPNNTEVANTNFPSDTGTTTPPVTQLPLTEDPPTTQPFSWFFLIWILGALVVTFRFITGHLKAMALRRASASFDSFRSSHDRLSSVELLQSSNTEMPLTCGIFRPAIIFPPEATNWDYQTQQAVIAHELTHIRRCDLFFLTISTFALALHWPNPFVWLAARKLRFCDERTADDAVVNEGVGERVYAQLLFDLARENTSSSSYLTARFMAESSTLSLRIKSLLDTGQNRKAPHPIAVIGGSLTIFAVAFLVGTATVQDISAEPEKTTAKAENGADKKSLEAKLKGIQLPIVDFDQVTLEEAIGSLRVMSKKFDDKEPDLKKKGVNIVLNFTKEEQAALAKKKFTLKLRNVPLKIALEHVVTNVGLRYRVGQYALEIGGKKLPVPTPTKKGAQGDTGKTIIEAKLKKIVCPLIDFNDVTLEEALAYFRKKAHELDSEPDSRKKGINFVLHLNNLNKAEQKALRNKKISLKLRNVPIATALTFTTKAFGTNYQVTEYAVFIGKK